MTSGLLRLVQVAKARVERMLERARYNPSNRAEYFRKQGVQVGEGCFLVPPDLGSTEPYLIKIGNHVAIANGVIFITHDGGPFIFRNEVPDIQVFGPIVIEDNCLIGQRAILFPNVRIGANSIVGAGSVVITDVPPNSIVMGVPARKIGDVGRYREKCIERWRDQRPDDVLLEPGETWWTSRHFGRNREALKRHLMKLFEKELSANTAPIKTPPAAEPSRDDIGNP